MGSTQRLRISAISYLNTAPLMWDFEHSATGGDFDVSYTLPSQCAKLLQQGFADIGIIPVAAYASIPDLAILPGVAIASRHAVRSILLVSKVSLANIESVAMDSSSMTSVALLKVLFAKWWRKGAAQPIFESANPDLKTMLEHRDAALLIGDIALQVDRSRYHTYDLAEAWIRLTGKPFVFAFWAVRQDALQYVHSTGELAPVFQTSRDHGLQSENIEQIVKLWAPRIGIGEAEVRAYLTENIHYYLDTECVAGMQQFFRYANESGALPSVQPLRFLDAQNSVFI
ncbi:MAG: menaquinone biosynthesis protein [Acidobacteriota bacterium]|nr:menaquinone biosynthesis protein [Acidobacteriota bacterium]